MESTLNKRKMPVLVPQLGVELWINILKQMIVGLELDGIYSPSVIVRYICSAAQVSKELREASFHALVALSKYLPKLRDEEIWKRYFNNFYVHMDYTRLFNHELRQCRIPCNEYRECFGKKNVAPRHRDNLINVVMWVHIEQQVIPEKMAIIIGRFFPDTFLNHAYIQRLWFCFKNLERSFENKSASECSRHALQLYKTSNNVIRRCRNTFVLKKEEREKMKKFLKARTRLFPNLHENLIFTWFEMSIPRRVSLK